MTFNIFENNVSAHYPLKSILGNSQKPSLCRVFSKHDEKLFLCHNILMMFSSYSFDIKYKLLSKPLWAWYKYAWLVHELGIQYYYLLLVSCHNFVRFKSWQASSISKLSFVTLYGIENREIPIAKHCILFTCCEPFFIPLKYF